MSIINKIKIELLFFVLLTVFIFISLNLDVTIKNFFEQINYSPVISKSSPYGNIYLEDFFLNITELGNSVWYFVFCIISIIFLFSNKKIKALEIKNGFKNTNLFISVIIFLIVNGLVTQLLKHVIGRARPNHTNFEDGFNFNLFTLNSEFHSFPSGHSSTIFMVCLILCKLMPNVKYLLFVFGFIVAFSRVVVNAHFFTDIVAGMIVAMIVFKSLNLIFEKFNKRFMIAEIEFVKNSVVINFVTLFLIAGVFLTIGPSLDIYISGLFYIGDPKFLIQRSDIFSIIFRDIFLPSILIYVLILPIFSKYFKIDRLYFKYSFSIKEFALIWISQVLIIVLFINSVLKSHWGRGRPEDIIQFGGPEIFTPWFRYSEACNTNCSFVSGDAAVGFSLIVLYFITNNKLFFYLGIIFGCSIGLIRILAGAHFLSDVLFAGLITIILNLVFFKLQKRYYG